MNHAAQANPDAAPIHFKAETRQLLDILIHSLYTEREIFVRELISNASDALTRMDFELLTNRDVLDPDVPLEIRIRADSEANRLIIEDTGVGMTADEMVANLGTIARSGAREFLQAVQQSGQKASDLIGQFGVGFYAVFMAAEWVRVTSRSYHTQAQAATWFCTGADTFTVESAERSGRGTTVEVQLKEDAREFSQEHRLREIVRKHSDFIPYPIYVGSGEEQANRQTALWRQSPREVESKDYDEFYQQLTLEMETPLAHAHMVVDAPVQMYAVLFIPSDPERGLFSLRREEGLKLYARKVLIQEYNRDLLPEYLGFVQGVVDSEDLPLNVARESVQSTRVIAHLKKLIKSKVIETLKKLAQDEPEKYDRFWAGFQRYLKQGVAVEVDDDVKQLYPLLRFRSTHAPGEWSSLDSYVEAMKPDQKAIYYILGDDERSVMYSPHLDIVRRYEYPVLLLTDPVDAFVLVRLTRYNDHPLVNVANADLELPADDKTDPDDQPVIAEQERAGLLDRFKQQLGERVSEVRWTDRLADSPARLVDPSGSPNPEMQRVYRMLNREFEAPKKTLELNPRHALLTRLQTLPPEDPLSALVIEQLYENALLIEGLHPDPAGMITRIQKIMEAALT